MANNIIVRLALEGAAAAASGLNAVGNQLGDLGRQAREAASSMGLFGGVVGLAGIGLTVNKLIAVQREFDVLNSSLITVSGSSAAAAREMEWIKAFAKETPFGLAQATQGFVKMKALGLDPTKAALTSFGNTASAMGKDLNQMIEAVADASTGEFERLKEFGITSKKEGDKVALTFQGITKTIGGSAEEITAYLEAIGNTAFAGAMEERAKTLDGAISGLADTWDELFRTVNANNTGGVIYDSVTLATKAIEDAMVVLNALNGVVDKNAQSTGVMATVQEGLATVFETVAALGSNVKYTLVQVGNELGGLAAQSVQILQGNFAGAAAIRTQMQQDGKTARAEIDATTARILGSRNAAKELATYATRNGSAAADPRRVDVAETMRAKELAKAYKAGEKALSDFTAAGEKYQSTAAKNQTTLAKEIDTARAALDAGKISASDYAKRITDVQAALGKKSGASEAQSAYESLAKSIKDKVREVENEIGTGEKLSASEKIEMQYKDALASKLVGLSAARRATIEASIAQLKADEIALATRKDEIRVHGERLSQRKAEEVGITAYMDAQEAAGAASYASIVKSVQAMMDEAEAAAISTAQHVSLAFAVEQVTISRLREAQAKTVEGMPEYERLQKEIDKRLELLGLITSKDAREAAAKNAKDAADEWSKSADQINQSLSDALMNGFQAGKGFGKSFVDSIKSMFNTMVLRPVISAIVTGATGSLGLTGAANAAGSGSSALGTAGSLFSAGSSAYTVGSQVLGGSMGVGNAAGTLWANAMTTGAGTALDGLLATNAAFGTVSTAATGASTALAQLAAAAPYIAAFVAAAYLASKYINTGTAHMGGGSQYSASGGLMTTATTVAESVSEGYWAPNGSGDPVWVADRRVTAAHMTGSIDPGFAGGFTGVGYSESTVAMTTGITQGIVSLLDSTAVTFGKTAGFMAATSFADDTSKDGAWGSLRIADAVGTVLTDWQASESFRTFSDGAAGSAEYQTAIAADVRAVLGKIGLPEWATSILAAIGDTPDLTTLGAAVAQIGLAKTALDQMGQKLAGFSAMSDAAVSSLIAASGGFDKLAASASTYYENFYTDAEKSATALASVAAALAGVNLTTPTTREGFRAMVEAQMALGETGAPAVAALLKVSDAFASAVAPMEDFSDAMKTATTSVSEEIARLRGLDTNGSQTSLMTQFAVLTGQARAGDATAMDKLPAISAALESASALNAVTAVDIARTRAWLANSLSATLQAAGIDGSHALGLASVPYDGYRAELHKGERVLTAQDNRIFSALARPGQSSADVVAELRAVRAELAAMQAQDKTIGESIAISTSRTAASTSKTAGIMERVTPDGDAMATRVAA